MKCFTIASLAAVTLVNVVYYVMEGSAKGVLLACLPFILAVVLYRVVRYENG